jgi:glucose-1-phosphate thymidylyltransferase
VEKPDPAVIAARDGSIVYVSMNSWCLPPQIYDACRAIAPSPRGEIELQSAVQYAIDELHVTFVTLPFREGVLDLSSRADIPAVAAALQSVTPVL